MVQNSRLVESKIYETWIPKLKKRLEMSNDGISQKTGRKITEAKLQQIAKMCHTRKLFEAATLDGVQGRGAFNFGNNPSTGVAGFYGTPGSAEVFQNLFGVFVEVAANNIGMELVPVIPMTKSSGSIYIAEPIYGNGRIDSTANRPLVFQIKQVKNSTAAALAVGTTYTIKTANSGGENIMDVIFVGVHRINGNFVFRLGQIYDNTGTGGTNWQTQTLAAALNSAVTGAGIYTSAPIYWSFTGSPDYVAGFTNFIAGYSGAGLNDSDDWFMNRGDGAKYGQAMSRQTGERTNYRALGIRTQHKNFSAETVHVDIEYTTEQIQDMQMDHGMNALEFGESIMQDQLNQHINEHILGRIFALGWSHHHQLFTANGFNLNAFIASAASTGNAQTFLGKDNTLLTISGPSGVLPSSGAIAENLSTLQRRIITRMMYASGIINNRSRRGKGDISVMNTTFATAVKDIRGFTPAPFPNDLNDSGLSMIGSLYGIKVYEDPLMTLNDERIGMARKGNDKDPGIKMCPYILAEKISTIAEGTMSPKEALKSRYALVECGSVPELNYLSFTVQTDAGFAIV